MHPHTHTHTHVCVCVCVWPTCTHACTYKHTYIQTHTHTRINTHKHAHTNVQKRGHIHTQTCMQKHTQMRPCTHTPTFCQSWRTGRNGLCQVCLCAYLCIFLCDCPHIHDLNINTFLHIFHSQHRGCHMKIQTFMVQCGARHNGHGINKCLQVHDTQPCMSHRPYVLGLGESLLQG